MSLETIVAQSTPQGVSAIALIRASGNKCTEIANKLFRLNPEKPIQPRHANFSSIFDATGELIDEVVWIYYPEKASYTAEPLLEIMPHGNPIICKKIVDAFCELDCRIAEPGEFTLRAYINGKLNFSQVEGILDVIHAQTDTALFYARKHLTGESGKHIKGIVQNLISVRAEIEAYIDFPEEELPTEDKEGPRQKLKTIIDTLEKYHATAKSQEVLQNGLNTLIIGAPNAGKSSLLNALVGHNRALVSETAGTTRDYIVERCFAGNFLINLFDTAGLNTHSIDEIESEGIHRTLELIDRTDFFLVVVDSTDEAPTLPNSVIRALTPENCLIIENKSDLPNAKAVPDFLPNCSHINVSTLQHDSVKHMVLEWSQLLNEQIGVIQDEGFMFNMRQAAFIKNAHTELSAARGILADSEATELAAFHLIRASEELLKINEHIDNESVLDNLFQRFCIGK